MTTHGKTPPSFPYTCPKCGAWPCTRPDQEWPLIVYDCGSSRVADGTYLMQTDKCKIRGLETQLKLAESTLARVCKERDTAQNLLTDILPLAMNANLGWDWNSIVKRICEALGIKEGEKTNAENT